MPRVLISKFAPALRRFFFSEKESGYAHGVGLYYRHDEVSQGFSGKDSGFSVRCVKD